MPPPADQGALRRADPDAHLQQPAGRDAHENDGFGRNESQTALPQRPQRRRERRRGQRASLPRHVLRLPLEHDAGAPRQDQHRRATDRRSGPDGNGGLVKVPGDFRELQGTMWFHDHRFFFTAENVYKGNLGMVNYYSGPDRGNEELNDGVNLRLPSGTLLDWGNIDFDVNLIISDAACDPTGQLFFDIFNTDGFLGDMPLVNFALPVLRGAAAQVPLPHPQRLHVALLQAGAVRKRRASPPEPVPFQFIANDGNLLVNPITAHAARRAGHRRALRHRRRLLAVQGRATRFTSSTC